MAEPNAGYGMRRQSSYSEFPPEFRRYVQSLPSAMQTRIRIDAQMRWRIWTQWVTQQQQQGNPAKGQPPMDDPTKPTQPDMGGGRRGTPPPGVRLGGPVDLPQEPRPIHVSPIEQGGRIPGQPAGDTPPTTGIAPPGEETPPGANPPPTPGSETAEGQALLGVFRAFLAQYGLDGTDSQGRSLIDYIKDWINLGYDYNRILLELRASEIYRNAFPEVAARREAGYAFWDEETIRRSRDSLRETAENFGLPVTREQISRLIGNDVSPAEFAHRATVYQRAAKFGGEVRALVEENLGINLTDDDLYEFFDPNINTKKLSDVLEEAEFRGRPAIYGLGRRSREEYDMLTQMGVPIEEAMGRYETAAARRAMFERLEAIETGVTGAQFFNEIPLERLIKGVVLRDQRTLDELSQQLAREVARFQVGGGLAFSGTQAAGGLSPSERSGTHI